MYVCVYRTYVGWAARVGAGVDVARRFADGRENVKRCGDPGVEKACDFFLARGFAATALERDVEVLAGSGQKVLMRVEVGLAFESGLVPSLAAPALAAPATGLLLRCSKDAVAWISTFSLQEEINVVAREWVAEQIAQVACERSASRAGFGRELVSEVTRCSLSAGLAGAGRCAGVGLRARHVRLHELLAALQVRT